MAVALEVENGLGTMSVRNDPRFGATVPGGVEGRVAWSVARSLDWTGHPMHPCYSVQKVANPLKNTGAGFKNVIVGKLTTPHSLLEYPPRLGF